MHAVDHDHAAAATPAQRATVVHAHQQAAIPTQLDLFAAGADEVDQEPDEVTERPEGRTADSATWLGSPENLDRPAAFTREADACRRAIADPQQPEQHTDEAGTNDQQQHRPRPDHDRGVGHDR
ncbi:hypothetical protein [Streptomyces pinistramenti]|uniref:hypothetical protein n=1 Tax=Streptomyces pinistramenti TaxID=2884812 RepID=UPI001D07F759|nr:hypothetical protein [Streptomyces pinistramenti]MCB5912348.1 hypothetical protein [Streptomyces pinistramenti]